MDESHFDALTRTFATSRRQALKLALGAAAAGALRLIGSTDGDAARRGFPGPSNPFPPLGCTIGGTSYPANTIDPTNPCHLCDPGLTRTAWSPRAGAFCGDGSQVCCDGDCCLATHCCGLSETCDPCKCEIDGVLHADGEPHPTIDCLVCAPTASTTAWSPRDDGSTCGTSAGRVCCNGQCCSPTECCEGIGVCTECGAHCLIGGVEISANTPHPTDPCLACLPEQAIDEWSPAAEGTRCNNGDGCCAHGACGPCSCSIGSDSIPDGQHNPKNDCEVCSFAANPTGWTDRPNRSSCGANLDRDCCDGECCPTGQCCTLDGCEPCCRIGSDTVADGVVNPNQTCQICDSSRNANDWSTLGNGDACGPTGNSECCNGECCPTGQCCRNGACGRCDCVIGTARIAPDTVNEHNPCEICVPERNRFGWSSAVPGTACGSDGATCCGTDCCAASLCCLLEACGECLCSIDNQLIEPDQHKEPNSCLYCDPRRDPFDWSTVANGGSCDDGRQCCNGLCCDAGLCCLGGACRACGCFIDGQEVGPGRLRPDNECQICDPATATEQWTTLEDGTACGDTGAQCCQAGVCINCGCLIGGLPFVDGEQNPDNECEQCDAALDPSHWSPRNEVFSCGDAGDGVCCAGICCPTGFVCNLDDTCTETGCFIDGTNVAPGTVNPANECQICLPSESTQSWTTLGDGEACGDTGAQCCMAGVCRNCGCLIGGDPYVDGEPNPQNECEQCDQALDPSNWSPRNETFTCGQAQDGVCCEGICCPSGNQCNLDGTCTPPGCLVDGENIAPGTLNPDNDCQICLPAESIQGWTTLSDGEACGETGAQCCQAGLCRNCGCLIEGTPFGDGEPNPDNECEQCDRALDPSGWSPRNETFACGEAGDGVCCEGVCCPSGNVCNLDGTCTPPGCLIGGVTYADGTIKPRERCEICDVANDPFDWTPRAIPDCAPPCTINGKIVRYGTPNPDNACQICRGGEDWSPSTELFCGDGTQNCCDGVCCDTGACCTDIGECGFDACTPEGCIIDGQQIEDGTVNPDNACLVCDVNTSTNSWTPQLGQCGPNFDRFCCNGVCCELGACCNNDEVCDFDFCQTCAIDGVLYYPEDRNPANTCQICSSSQNKIGWTTLPDSFFCDEIELSVCCGGACCNPGEACISGSCQTA